MKVGFVGLGVMGQSMALNLVRAGHEVTVYNRTESRCEPLQKAGARVAQSPREAAQAAECCITIVTDDAAVEAVSRGPNGVLAGLGRGAIAMDMSTISPKTTRSLAQDASSQGVTWLDAPVTGGDVGARDGTLTIMVGGVREAFERVQPLLQAMGKRIVYVGESGHGQSMKLVANLVSGMTLMAAAEGLRLGQAVGLPLETMGEILPFSSAQSFEVSKLLDRLQTENYKPGFSVANRTKDLRLAAEMASEIGFDKVLTGPALEALTALTRERPNDDESSYLLRWQP